jgi:hypothetical protein
MPIPADHLTKGNREYTICVPVSFEAGEQVTAQRVKIPNEQEAELIGVDYEVVKALAGTDAGSILVKDAAGNTIATIAIPLSSALGVRSADPVTQLAAAATDALMERRRIRLDPTSGYSGYLSLTSAKTTAGGKALVWLHFKKLRRGGSL